MTWNEELTIELVSKGERFEATHLQVEIAATFAAHEHGWTIWDHVAMHEKAFREVHLGRTRERFQRSLDTRGITRAQYDTQRFRTDKKIVVTSAVCEECGTEFDVTKYRGDRGNISLCSRACVSRRAHRLKRENARHYEIDGVSLTLAEWCRRRNIGFHVAWQRIRRGWDIRRALGMKQGDGAGKRAV